MSKLAGNIFVDKVETATPVDIIMHVDEGMYACTFYILPDTNIVLETIALNCAWPVITPFPFPYFAGRWPWITSTPATSLKRPFNQGFTLLFTALEGGRLNDICLKTNSDKRDLFLSMQILARGAITKLVDQISIHNDKKHSSN